MDNVVLNAGAGGVTAVAASVTFSGDSAYAQGVFLGVLSGSADAYTYSLSVGGAGAVTAGTPRMTLASDDPAVVSLAILDDWDESDRCKVNPIAGQAGVAGGSGTVSALTQRVVLATDVALPTGSNVIGAVTQSGTWNVVCTNAGTFVVQVNGDALTALQLLDDAVATTASAITAKGFAVAGTDGTNARILKTDTNGELQVDVLSMPTTTITGTVAATQSGTWNITDISGTVSLPTGASTLAEQQTQTTALQIIDDAFVVDGAASIANRVVQIGANDGSMTYGLKLVVPADDISNSQRGLCVSNFNLMYDGTTWDRVRGTSADGLLVNLGSNNDVTVTGTVAATQSGTWNITNVSGTVSLPTGASTLAEQQTQTTALQLIDDTVYTDDAAFTPGTSKLLVIGAQADEDSTDAVDEGDAGALRMTLERKLRTVAAIDSASMQSGNDQVTPKFAIIDASTSGDNTLIAAVASKKIRVLNVVLVASGTVTVRFESGASGTALTGQMQLTAQTGFSSGFCPVGHFETATNTLLNLELSGATSVDGWITYIEVD